MAHVRFQVTIPHNNGLPRDAVTNRFDFEVVDVDNDAIFADIVDKLKQVWNFNYDGNPGDTIANLMSDQMAAGACHITGYNMDLPEPRAPIVEELFAIFPPASVALPHEVALCGSFQGDPEPGIPMARRRGRVYFGPLNSSAGAEAGGDYRPSTAALNIVSSALGGLRDAGGDLEVVGWRWVVASMGARNNTNQAIPYEDRPLLPKMLTPITTVWCDNSFDTQRRRGTSPTARTFG